MEGRPAWEAALQEAPLARAGGEGQGPVEPLPVSGSFLAVCPLVQIDGRQYCFLEGGALWRLGAGSRGLGRWEILLGQEGEAQEPLTHSLSRARASVACADPGEGWPAARSVRSGPLWDELIMHNFDPQLSVSTHLSTVLNNKLSKMIRRIHTSICIKLYV